MLICLSINCHVQVTQLTSMKLKGSLSKGIQLDPDNNPLRTLVVYGPPNPDEDRMYFHAADVASYQLLDKWGLRHQPPVHSQPPRKPLLPATKALAHLAASNDSASTASTPTSDYGPASDIDLLSDSLAAERKRKKKKKSESRKRKRERDDPDSGEKRRKKAKREKRDKEDSSRSERDKKSKRHKDSSSGSAAGSTTTPGSAAAAASASAGTTSATAMSVDSPLAAPATPTKRRKRKASDSQLEPVVPWSEREDRLLLEALRGYVVRGISWDFVADVINGTPAPRRPYRTARQTRDRYETLQRPGSGSATPDVTVKSEGGTSAPSSGAGTPSPYVTFSVVEIAKRLQKTQKKPPSKITTTNTHSREISTALTHQSHVQAMAHATNALASAGKGRSPFEIIALLQQQRATQAQQLSRPASAATMTLLRKDVAISPATIATSTAATAAARPPAASLATTAPPSAATPAQTATSAATAPASRSSPVPPPLASAGAAAAATPSTAASASSAAAATAARKLQLASAAVAATPQASRPAAASVPPAAPPSAVATPTPAATPAPQPTPPTSATIVATAPPPRTTSTPAKRTRSTAKASGSADDATPAADSATPAPAPAPAPPIPTVAPAPIPSSTPKLPTSATPPPLAPATAAAVAAVANAVTASSASPALVRQSSAPATSAYANRRLVPATPQQFAAVVQTSQAVLAPAPPAGSPAAPRRGSLAIAPLQAIAPASVGASAVATVSPSAANFQAVKMPLASTSQPSSSSSSSSSLSSSSSSSSSSGTIQPLVAPVAGTPSDSQPSALLGLYKTHCLTQIPSAAPQIQEIIRNADLTDSQKLTALKQLIAEHSKSASATSSTGSPNLAPTQ